MPAPTRRDVHIDTAMTNVSIAYRNETYIAEQVFPMVPVVKESGKYFVFNKAAWFRDEARPRAPGVEAQRVDYRMDSAGTYVCIEYAMAKGIPDELRENADEPLRPEIEAVEFVTDKLQLALERRVATLMFTAANWDNSATPSPTWDDDTSDPLGDMVTARDAVLQAIGRIPNVLVLGWQTFSQLKHHPDLLDRIKYTERGILTTELMAGLFEVDKVLVGSAVYETALEDATSSMAYIWGKHGWLGYVPPRPSLMVPAAGYTVKFKNRVVNRFREDTRHQDLFECIESSDEIVTSSAAGYMFSSAVA